MMPINIGKMTMALGVTFKLPFHISKLASYRDGGLSYIPRTVLYTGAKYIIAVWNVEQ